MYFDNEFAFGAFVDQILLDELGSGDFAEQGISYRVRYGCLAGAVGTWESCRFVEIVVVLALDENDFRELIEFDLDAFGSITQEILGKDVMKVKILHGSKWCLLRCRTAKGFHRDRLYGPTDETAHKASSPEYRVCCCAKPVANLSDS